MILKIELVSWCDARVGPGGWIKRALLSASGKLVECTTIGFVLEEDHDRLVIVGTVNDADEILSPVVIPKTWIRTRRVVMDSDSPVSLVSTGQAAGANSGH